MSDAPNAAPAAAPAPIPDTALPPGADPNYAQQMVDRAEGKPVDPPKEPAKDAPPANDWEKRYKDLQAEYTRLKQGKPAEEAPKEPPKEGEPPKAEGEQAAPPETPAVSEEAQQAKSVLDSAGLDWDAVNAHYAQNGNLSDDHFAALEKVGIPRQMAEQYVEGQKALNSQRRAEVLSTIGGEEAYKAVTEWAAKNLSADEIKSYNTIVSGSDINASKIAIAGLNARYAAANGSEPKLISGETGQSAFTGFRSTAELKTAMADPRYKTDPAYRQDVQNRLAVSSIM